MPVPMCFKLGAIYFGTVAALSLPSAVNGAIDTVAATFGGDTTIEDVVPVPEPAPRDPAPRDVLDADRQSGWINVDATPADLRKAANSALYATIAYIKCPSGTIDKDFVTYEIRRITRMVEGDTLDMTERMIALAGQEWQRMEPRDRNLFCQDVGNIPIR